MLYGVFTLLSFDVFSDSPDFFAFGESYGGTYVVSLARKFLMEREADANKFKALNFKVS